MMRQNFPQHCLINPAAASRLARHFGPIVILIVASSSRAPISAMVETGGVLVPVKDPLTRIFSSGRGPITRKFVIDLTADTNATAADRVAASAPSDTSTYIELTAREELLPNAIVTIHPAALIASDIGLPIRAGSGSDEQRNATRVAPAAKGTSASRNLSACSANNCLGAICSSSLTLASLSRSAVSFASAARALASAAAFIASAVSSRAEAMSRSASVAFKFADDASARARSMIACCTKASPACSLRSFWLLRKFRNPAAAPPITKNAESMPQTTIAASSLDMSALSSSLPIIDGEHADMPARLLGGICLGGTFGGVSMLGFYAWVRWRIRRASQRRARNADRSYLLRISP